ncbi:DUF805 domain-containing protein [Euryarchaeota archaeon]|nr:DUF805 domain-containing protein [Euryarchaeota archaeon]
MRSVVQSVLFAYEQYMLANFYHLSELLRCMEVNGGPMVTGRPTGQIGFIDAARKALIYNYANFNGRASRSEYWWFFLFYFLVSIPVTILDLMTGIVVLDMGIAVSYGPLAILTMMVFFLPSLSLLIRRLHDLGRSGWWFLIAGVPCVGYIILFVFLIQDGQPHPNKHGEVPTNIL